MVPGLYKKNSTSPLNVALNNPIMPLTRKESTDPQIKTEKGHTDFYRERAVDKLGSDHKAMYDSMKNKSQADADAIIALAGGTHKFTPEKKTPQRVVFPKLGVKSSAGKSKTGGFRYKKDLPAKGSITKKA